MSKQLRSFTPDFKHEAASLLLDQDYSCIEAARGGVTPTSKALTPEQQKIQELEARINRLEREKSTLKKATALLMAEEHERSR